MNLFASRFTIGSVAALVVLAVAVAILRNRSKPPGKIDISGGAIEQRARIDRAIDSASALDIDEAVKSLSEYNEQYELAGLASMSPSSIGLLYINQLLADRRVSKIFGHFLTLPDDEACSQAEEIFGDKFATFHGMWKRFAKGEDVYGDLGPCHHAASASLLLYAYFCPPKVLDEKIAFWDKTMMNKEFGEVENLWQLSVNRFIDPLFRLNLLVISGQRDGASLENLNKQLDRVTRKITGDDPFLKVTHLRMFKWDAETMDTDFTHVTRGVPSAEDSVLCELPGFSDPNSGRRLQNPEVGSHLEDVIQVWRRSKQE